MPAAKPPGFRRRALDLVVQRNPVAQVAKDLGISESCWRLGMLRHADSNLTVTYGSKRRRGVYGYTPCAPDEGVPPRAWCAIKSGRRPHPLPGRHPADSPHVN